MSEELKFYPITHGGIEPVVHPRLETEIHGQTAIAYLRFFRPVLIEKLELKPGYARYAPEVPTHPAHLKIAVLDRESHRWKQVREVDLPADPRIAGEGLSQDMSMEEMDVHFKRAIEEVRHTIPLDGIETDHLRVECDREHPVWPSHGEFDGGEFSVPFCIFKPLKAYGHALCDDVMRAPYNPLLAIRKVNAKAPDGMELEEHPETLHFSSDRLSVAFSLRRPMLMHLGWDALGLGQAQDNRLLASRATGAYTTLPICGWSGPLLRTLEMDVGAHLWTGEVAVNGNRIRYSGLRAVSGVTIDAVFTVEADRLILELEQTCEKPYPVVESEAWRFIWNMAAGSTGAAGMPTLRPGRNGDVALPAFWATDGVGCLACRLLEGDPETARLQVESYHDRRAGTGGLVLAPRPESDSCLVLPKGTQRAVFELAVTNLEPEADPESRVECGEAIGRHWATVYSCFRSEYAGFSNNAVSGNCHVNQYAPVEIAARTRKPKDGPNPLDLARFTVERALLYGGGYGYWRNLYYDSDPILVSAAGRIHQVDPDMKWLKRIEPGLREAFRLMTNLVGEQGLLVCRDLSGNSGTYRFSTNAMDVIGMGHLDACVNALAYRAFRNASALFAELGQKDLQSRARDLADQLKGSYASEFLNPDTGWVAGWRSRDGVLHDYAFTWVNGVALAFGLLDSKDARTALQGLERLRREVGLASARMGLPCNLWPIKVEDHITPKLRDDAQPTFETYADGGLSSLNAFYYLRALSIYGLKKEAQALTSDLEEGYAAGMFSGGVGTGHEWRSWEGCPSGDEGTLIVDMAALYSIAIEKNIFTPLDPEWWPAG